MVNRGKKPKKTGRTATVKTPVGALKGKDSIGHYNAVLLEDIKGQMKQVLEGVGGAHEEMRREIGEFRKETNQRFDGVEATLRSHSKSIAELKTEMVAMETRLTGDFKSDMKSMETRLAGEFKSDMKSMETRLTGEFKSDMKSMETRLTGEFKSDMKSMETRLSGKIDGIGTKVDDHEVRITTLESGGNRAA